ncbi:MAG: dTMP kinase [Deltaproteobacteria bacterium]
MGRFSFFGQGIPRIDPQELKGKLIVIEGADGVGRSTQIWLLKQWLEIKGYAVVATRMTRSALAGKGLRQAKKGTTLGRVTMALFYATDFADRLEHEIIPALKAGFIVLTDRYIYTLIARALVRGIDAPWIQEVYGFALKPDRIFYLRAGVDALVTRVLQEGGFDYWESGMDLHLGEDMYESFVEYQNRMIGQFDKMVEDYGFDVIDASRSIDEVFTDLKAQISMVVNTAPPVSSDPIGRLKQFRTGAASQDIPRAESLENMLRHINGGSSGDPIVESGRKELGLLARR